MADPIRAKLDTQAWDGALTRLGGKAIQDLAASMAVAGGQVLRDQAKRLAPVDSGTLRDSIYLAYREAKTNDRRVMYSVSWNSRVAPHGHLLEFGHWLVKGGKTGKGGERVAFVAARPFLGPALQIAADDAKRAMLERGKQRLPELLRDANGAGN
jgi:hypothetical protein